MQPPRLNRRLLLVGTEGVEPPIPACEAGVVPFDQAPGGPAERNHSNTNGGPAVVTRLLCCTNRSVGAGAIRIPVYRDRATVAQYAGGLCLEAENVDCEVEDDSVPKLLTGVVSPFR